MKQREIKFRAFDKKNNLMIEEVIMGIDHVGFPFDEDIMELLKSKGFDEDNLPDNWSDTGEDWILILEDFEVIQYIGLKDKNCFEIYEGDRVQFDVDSVHCVGTVRFSHQMAGWFIDYQLPPFRTNYSRGFNVTYGDGETYIDDTIEVIGNIYQNPELIK